MKKFSGSDLYKVFVDFNVEMGNVDENCIKAWFDIYCEDRMYLLNWLCTLKKANLLQPSEKEDYDEVVSNNVMYSEAECDSEINNITSQYPGLFDVDILWDMDLLENEMMLLTEAELNQQNELLIHDNVCKTISNNMKRSTEELRNVVIMKNNEFQNCLNLAEELDNLNERLQKQIENCGRNLQHFEYPITPLFISNINMNTYNEYFNSMISLLSTSVRNDYVTQSLSETILRNSLNDTHGGEVLVFKERIFRSTWKRVNNQIQGRKLKAELQFLNCLESKSFFSLNKSIMFELDTAFEKKQHLNGIHSAKLQRIFRKMTDKRILLPKVNLAKNKISYNWKKFAEVVALEFKVLNFLVKEIILHILHKLEQDDIGNADKFFRNLLDYISIYLRSSQSRTEIMLEKICEHETYRQLSLEDQEVFIKSVATILSNKYLENNSLVSIVDAVYRLENETNKISQNVFDVHFQQHQAECRKIEKWIAKVKDFFESGATTKLLVVSPHLLAVFRESDELLEQQKQLLMDMVKTLKKEMTKYNRDKWLQIRKHLWMYFIIEPSKLEGLYEQIKSAASDL